MLPATVVMLLFAPSVTIQISFLELADSAKSFLVISLGTSLSFSPFMKNMGHVTYFTSFKLSHLIFKICFFKGPNTFKNGNRMSTISVTFVNVLSITTPLNIGSFKVASKFRATAPPRDLPIKKTRSLLTLGEALMYFTIALASS